MHDLGTESVGRLTAILLTLGIGLVACNPASSQPAASEGGPGSSNGPGSSSAAASAGGPLPSGGVDVQGSLVSSGAYSATWTWTPGNAADVGTGGITLNSDKGAFGNVAVAEDGSITFTSGASELSAGSPFYGTGAQVHNKTVGGVDLPCSFTLDNDVTGSEGTVVHLKGTLTIIGTIWEC